MFVDHWGFATIGRPLEEERPVLRAPLTNARPPVSRYIAPEQAAGGGEIDARADVYALGAILFRILTLRNFNTGETEEEIVAQALKPGATPPEALVASPSPAHVLNGISPQRLNTICTHALSHDRAARFTTAHEMKMEIVDAVERSAAREERHSSRKLFGLFGRR